MGDVEGKVAWGGQGLQKGSGVRHSKIGPPMMLWVRLGRLADVRCMTVIPPKAEVHPRSCYVAFVPDSDIDQIIRSPRRRWRAAPAGSFEPRGRQADHVCQ